MSAVLDANGNQIDERLAGAPNYRPARIHSVADVPAEVQVMLSSDRGFAFQPGMELPPSFTGGARPLAAESAPVQPLPTLSAGPDVPTAPAPPTTKLILSTHLSLGDLVCFTAVPRAIHWQAPGRFHVSVRTPFPQLFENNPHICFVGDDDPDAVKIDCHYPAVNQSNQRNVHLIEGYCEHLGHELWTRKLLPSPILRPALDWGKLCGDIYLSEAERGWMSMPHEHFGVQRYWLISVGGKNDFTVKWPIPEVMQQVVDHFRGRIQFVQVGVDPQLNKNHECVRLKNVIDVVGKTDVRQLIRIVHSASGVLSGITSLVHLAAAVPRPSWMQKARACVVVAGGREPRSWYSYATTTVLDVVGKLGCCAQGGCWKSRTVPLGDAVDDAGRVCERVINDFPQCMWLITPKVIIEAIEGHLTAEQAL